MNVVAVIVEQLEADGRIKRLTIARGSAHQLEVAFPDEFEGERSGPFFFPNKDDEEQFKKEFADSRILKLSKNSFTAVNGDYNLRIERGGIPTERGQLSYYSLSLPEFAIPTEISLKDPHSNKPLYKSVFTDKQRKRFVIYVECRSSHGVFDFLLDVRFKIERDNFRDAKYEDDYLSRHGGQVKAYKRLLPPDEEGNVKRFFSGESEPSQARATPSTPSRGVAADNGTLFSTPADEGDLADRERRGKDCYDIIGEARQIRHLFGRGQKMFEIRQEHGRFRIWAVVSNLPKEDQETFEHPNQWGSIVSYTHGLLGNAYGKHPTTVRDWVKAYRRRSTSKK
jgi:hypothetical protein